MHTSNGLIFTRVVVIIIVVVLLQTFIVILIVFAKYNEKRNRLLAVVLRMTRQYPVSQHYHKNTSTARRNPCRTKAGSYDDGRDIDDERCAIHFVDRVVVALREENESIHYSFAIPWSANHVFLRRRNTLLRQKQTKNCIVRI